MYSIQILSFPCISHCIIHTLSTRVTTLLRSTSNNGSPQSGILPVERAIFLYQMGQDATVMRLVVAVTLKALRLQISELPLRPLLWDIKNPMCLVDLKEVALVLNVRLSEDLASAVFNGKVVSLCCSDQQAAISTMADKPLQWYGCGFMPIRTLTLDNYTEGLIRGRDVGKGNVYIITPTSDAQLSNVNTMVYSDWVPELRGLESTLNPDTHVPNRTASHYHHRQFVFAPKRRYNPAQILKMSRKS